MSPEEQLAAEKAAREQAEAKAAAAEAELKRLQDEQDQALREGQHDQNADFAEALVKEGRLKPADKDLVVQVLDFAEAESLFNEQAKATRRATKGVQLRQEIETAALLQAKSAYQSGHTKDLAATKKWSADNSDPLADIESARETVRAACGVRPGVLVVGASVLSQLKRNKALLASLSANDRKSLLTVEQLKNLLELDDIIVGQAVSSVATGKPTKDVWGKFASLIVRPNLVSDGNDEGEPAFGYTFRRRGMPVVDRYEEVGGKVEYARYTDIRKAAVVGSACGFLFENAVD